MCKNGFSASKAIRFFCAVFLILLLALPSAGCGSRPAPAEVSSQTEISSQTEMSSPEEVSSQAESASGEELSLIETESLPEEEPENGDEGPESLPEASQNSSEEAVGEQEENESSSVQESPGGLLTAPMDPESPEDGLAFVTEDGEYSSKEQVAAYLNEFGHLPGNYITKREAEDLGWVSSEGNLWDVAPGKSIGGSRFGNYEKLLPEKKGRKYYECDIDFDGTYRGPKRIIYSNDGLIFYTEDHYKTFEQLY